MSAKDIAFIAPFPGLAEMAREVLKKHSYPASVMEGNLYEAVKLAYEALSSGAKVVISRGGTAKLIQTELGEDFSIGVIEVEVSAFNVVECLHRNTTSTDRVGIIGFPQFTAVGGAVCESMDLAYRTFEIPEEHAALEKVEALGRWNADIILGDVISCKLMSEFGWDKFHLIESSQHSVREAFSRAALVLENVDRRIASNHKLSTILECSQEGIAILDGGGWVEEMNGRCKSLLRLPQTPSGIHFATLLDDAELSSMLVKKREVKGIVVDYRGEQLILDIIKLSPPVTRTGMGGMVVVIQPVKRIQEMESKIRTRLHKKGFNAKRSFPDIVHHSEAMKRSISAARAAAQSDANIVITGETGSGKEIFAQSIHNASSRREGMFVAVNCSAMPAGLLESEMFGYSPGAFTGALRSGKPGLFEIAHQGTLFLDEVNELDLFLQPRLLRAIQEREIMRIGDSKVIPVDVRIIAASNKELECEVAEGKMRADLFFRLNVLRLHIPPLREREGDVAPLFLHYLRKASEERSKAVKAPGEKFLRQLEEYQWPGNVRELENMVERYIVMQEGAGVQDLHELLSRSPAGLPYSGGGENMEGRSLDEIVETAIRKTMVLEEGNISRTAKRLGVNRNTVKRWLRKNAKT